MQPVKFQSAIAVCQGYNFMLSICCCQLKKQPVTILFNMEIRAWRTNSVLKVFNIGKALKHSGGVHSAISRFIPKIKFNKTIVPFIKVIYDHFSGREWKKCGFFRNCISLGVS